MRVLHDLTADTEFQDPVVTLGTFDGVHLGHQEILRSMIAEARARGSETVLLTFHPHPRLVLYPDNHTVQLIDTVEEKLEKLEKLGLDTVILYPFTSKFSKTPAEDFVKEILVDKIGVKEMVIGYDHHFGKNREGDYAQLAGLGRKYGFTVREISAFSKEGNTISSTKIRKAVAEGDMKTARAFLGTPFQLTGTVIHGNKLGRTIGFPTANVGIDQNTKMLPELGVYAVKIAFAGKMHDGVMNVGKKPTVQQSEKITCEVYIFDFSDDIYGETVRVFIFERLRGEQRFISIDALKEQLGKDEKDARSVLAALD